VTVDGAVGVIADDAQVESLAGIMGGDSTAVSDETRHIYVEAAFWWPQAIAGRSVVSTFRRTLAIDSNEVSIRG
jgi:phenylalanyl-tRNA synthetase beta chain